MKRKYKKMITKSIELSIIIITDNSDRKLLAKMLNLIKSFLKFGDKFVVIW
jgi:hypothetical protein